MLLQIMPDLVALVKRVKGGLKGVTCVCVFGDGGRWEGDESR